MALEYKWGFFSPTPWYPMADRQPLALVLEDTELGRWALTRALEADGFGVRAVSTWAEASERLRLEEFTLALVAASSAPANLGHITGEIRRDHPNTHLVLLADQDSIDELRLACGPEPEILAKPFDLEEVAHAALSRTGSADKARGA
jgi:DNA-binding NtrC family response regulator